MSRWATLDSIKKKEQEENNNSSSSSSSNTNEYYSGGASAQGGSGLNVMAPPSPSNNPDAIQRIMELARRNNEQQESIPEDRPIRTVTFYRNGFTIDNGIFRPLGTRENDEFVKSISDGYCPAELVDQSTGLPANIKLNDKSGENYEEPAPASYIAFSGEGQAAGSSSETTLDHEQGIILPGTEINDTIDIKIPENESTIRVQVRFPSNKRIVVKLLKIHTIRHLLVAIEKSEYAPSNAYQLLFTPGPPSPPKPIDSSKFDQTVVEVGIAGAVVTVKDVEF